MLSTCEVCTILPSVEPFTPTLNVLATWHLRLHFAFSLKKRMVIHAITTLVFPQWGVCSHWADLMRYSKHQRSVVSSAFGPVWKRGKKGAFAFKLNLLNNLRTLRWFPEFSHKVKRKCQGYVGISSYAAHTKLRTEAQPFGVNEALRLYNIWSCLNSTNSCFTL